MTCSMESVGALHSVQAGLVEDWVRMTSETSELHLGVAQRYSPELLFMPDSDLGFNHCVPGWLRHRRVLVEER